MNTRRMIGTLGAAFIIVLVLVFLIFQTRVQAALGNVGYPITCLKSNMTAGNTYNLSCFNEALQGTFGESFIQVPTGYYLLVADVLVTPHATCGLEKGLLQFYLYDSYTSGSTTYNEDGFPIRELDRETFAFSFQSPGLIVQATHFLRAETNSGNVCSVDLRVTGWLVTNLSFLPVATK